MHSVHSWQVWRFAWRPFWNSDDTLYEYGNHEVWRRLIFGLCWMVTRGDNGN